MVVFTTAGSEEEAELLKTKMIESKLAACVNQAQVSSLFSWKGKLEKAKEVMLIVKTKSGLFAELEKIIKKYHSYEVPEIIALPIIAANKPYLDWIDQTTK
jgi:periplasmic divalent cation tolerance protein